MPAGIPAAIMSTCQLMFLPFVFSLLNAPNGRRMTLGKKVPEALSSTQQPLLLHRFQRHHGIQVCSVRMNVCAPPRCPLPWLVPLPGQQ